MVARRPFYNGFVNKEWLQQIAARLKQNYGAQKVVLFGSAAQGAAGPGSDVDLLVISPTTEGYFQRMATVRGMLRDLRRGLAVCPIVLTPEEVQSRLAIGDHFISDIMTQGIEL